MGTRNLTMVIDGDGQTKVAQYGQWDGYPSGNGVKILDFLRSQMGYFEPFKNALKGVSFMDELDDKSVEKYISSIGCADGYMTAEQSELFTTKYPQLSRDLGMGVLEMIIEAKEPLKLKDDSDFAGDSLFCEWAYVIDLQESGHLEVYKGFNQIDLTKDDRFYSSTNGSSEYKPIKLVAKYRLDDLPTNEEFLNELEPSNWEMIWLEKF